MKNHNYKKLSDYLKRKSNLTKEAEELWLAAMWEPLEFSPEFNKSK